ncbi:MAG: hypothetical protein ACLFTQ_03705 [Candidatus Aenigmatarchaeota archaeon]
MELSEEMGDEARILHHADALDAEIKEKDIFGDVEIFELQEE